MRTVSGLMGAVLLLGCLAVLPVDGRETKAKTTYGNCQVWTNVDPLDGKWVHVVRCGSSDGGYYESKGYVSVSRNSEGRWAAGLGHHPSSLWGTMEVAWRFDDGELKRDGWFQIPAGDYGSVSKEGRSFVDGFLDGLATSSRIVFKISIWTTKDVDLYGVEEAVADFLAR